MGTRRCMFNYNTPLYNQAIDLFHNSEISSTIVELTNEYHKRKVERITTFVEFFGPSSFAGTHDFNEQKELKLLDVFVFKKGFIAPKDFVKLFNQYQWAAEVVYTGNMNTQFIQDVRNGKYPVYEGVICKGGDWNAKIKTIEYLERLKTFDPKLWAEQCNE